MQEHELIVEVLASLQAMAEKLKAGATVPRQDIADFGRFFRDFADKCHHGKEEDLLFPFMERKGVPRDHGPLGCMLAEHDEGRAFIRAMKQNAEACARGERDARRRWAVAAQGYSTLLRKHIWKENEILFQIAEKVLSSDEQAELAVRFKQVQAKKLDTATRDRLEQTKAKIERELAAAMDAS